MPEVTVPSPPGDPAPDPGEQWQPNPAGDELPPIPSRPDSQRGGEDDPDPGPEER